MCIDLSDYNYVSAIWTLDEFWLLSSLYAYLRRILESLLNELASRNILEHDTIQNIVDEGKPSIIPIHN